MHFSTPPTTLNCMQNFRGGGQNVSFPTLLDCYRGSLLIVISPNEYQMRLLTRTKLRYCSIVSPSLEAHNTNFSFLTSSSAQGTLVILTCCWRALARQCIKRNNNTKLFRMKDRRLRSWLVYDYNIIGDELLLNFGAKFQRQFVISHVKLQNCHGNPSVRLSVKLTTKF